MEKKIYDAGSTKEGGSIICGMSCKGRFVQGSPSMLQLQFHLQIISLEADYSFGKWQYRSRWQWFKRNLLIGVKEMSNRWSRAALSDLYIVNTLDKLLINSTHTLRMSKGSKMQLHAWIIFRHKRMRISVDNGMELEKNKMAQITIQCRIWYWYLFAPRLCMLPMI